MGFLHSVKAAGKGFVEGYSNASKAQTFTAAGKPVVCPHCENLLFHRHDLAAHDVPPLGIGTQRVRATCLVCAHCSRMEWFADSLEGETPKA